MPISLHYKYRYTSVKDSRTKDEIRRPYSYPKATLIVTIPIKRPLRWAGVISCIIVTLHGAKNPTTFFIFYFNLFTIPSIPLSAKSWYILLLNADTKQMNVVMNALILNGNFLPYLSVNYPDARAPIKNPTLLY